MYPYKALTAPELGENSMQGAAACIYLPCATAERISSFSGCIGNRSISCLQELALNVPCASHLYVQFEPNQGQFEAFGISHATAAGY